MEETQPPEPDADRVSESVLVPVPREMVVEVTQYLARLQWAGSGIRGWSQEELIRLLEGLDDQGRTLVRAVAHAKLVGDRDLVDTQVARSTGLTTREVAGLVREINDVAEPGTLELIVLLRTKDETGAMVRRLTMIESHASAVIEADDERLGRVPKIQT